MAKSKRYSVRQADLAGYDWYVIHTDNVLEALRVADESRQNGHTTDVVDHETGKSFHELWEVEDSALPTNPVHPVFQGIFDSFLSACAEDTVNNGDTLHRRRNSDYDTGLTVAEARLEEERRCIEVDEQLDNDGRFKDEGPVREDN